MKKNKHTYYRIKYSSGRLWHGGPSSPNLAKLKSEAESVWYKGDRVRIEKVSLTTITEIVYERYPRASR